MMSREERLQEVVDYMQAHWPSRVRAEWLVSLGEYAAISERVVKEWAEGASRGKELVRIAGLSGSGKTTQLLPAVEGYFDNDERAGGAVLVAARRFVERHPHYEEILAEYGEAELRKMTDEFATIMMFLVLEGLIKLGADIILDVTLLEPAIEGILIGMLCEGRYRFWMTMVALSPELAEKHLGQRAWRHSRETELEFIRATRLALQYYAGKAPEMRIVIWDAWEESPVYDGEVRGCMEVYDKYSALIEIPEHSEEGLRSAKREYFTRHTN